MPKSKIRPVESYEVATRIFIDDFERYVMTHFGPPCTTTGEDCAICNLWALYDAARELTDVDG